MIVLLIIIITISLSSSIALFSVRLSNAAIPNPSTKAIIKAVITLINGGMSIVKYGARSVCAIASDGKVSVEIKLGKVSVPMPKVKKPLRIVKR